MYLTEKQIQRILCAAVKKNLLIVADSTAQATFLRILILEYIKNFMPKLKTQHYTDKVFISGYNSIAIIGIDSFIPSRWSGFDGDIYSAGTRIPLESKYSSLCSLIGEPHGSYNTV